MNTPIHRRLIHVPAVILLLCRALLTCASGAAPAVAPPASPLCFTLGGGANRVAVDAARLPAGTDPALFSYTLLGAWDSFGLYAGLYTDQNNMDAIPIGPGKLQVEIGFVETEATGPDQRIFQVSANGKPLCARVDVFQLAGGAFKPYVLKAEIEHTGGILCFLFTGTRGKACVSFIRVLRDGRPVAFGSAAQWTGCNRITMMDVRSREAGPVKAGTVPFFNEDHAPLGAWATFIYGMEASGGLEAADRSDTQYNLVPHFGIIVAAKSGGTTRVMPFYSAPDPLPAGASLVRADEVTRRLRACSDQWKMPLGVSWTHYTPVWEMKDWDTATPEEKQRFALPSTTMAFQLHNSTGKDELEFVFSLEQPGQRAAWPGFEGYTVNGAGTVAVASGDAVLASADEVKKEFGLNRANAAFVVRVPAGQNKSFEIYTAHYVPGQVSALNKAPLSFMSAELFKDTGEVLAFARASREATKKDCDAWDARLAASGINPERQELAAHALHAYQFNTLLMSDMKSGAPVFSVQEGECKFINTMDLTVDQVFYELAVHPWTVRNELDLYADYFNYKDSRGLGFAHDMGGGFGFARPGTGGNYGTYFTQEEVLNWAACAALYWRATGDNAWLARRKPVLKSVLESMLNRDDMDPAKRDGITSYGNGGEITTYDGMDSSLRSPCNSLYITVKSFGTYLVLEKAFASLNEDALAAECRAGAARCAKSVLVRWDAKNHYFPAIFDGQNQSRIIPAIEGLAYPYAMGLRQELAMDGPYGDFLQHLKMHLETVLVPGVCLDPVTGGWALSSTADNTWQSKVYLNQTVAEKVLGICDARTGGRVDEVHLGYEVNGAPAVGWSCVFLTSSHVPLGCRHYPRGVTSALWWLPKPGDQAPVTTTGEYR